MEKKKKNATVVENVVLVYVYSLLPTPVTVNINTLPTFSHGQGQLF